MEHANPLLIGQTSPKFITFGEVMLRLTPPNYEKIRVANDFEASYGGSEANIALEDEIRENVQLEGNVGCWIGVFMAWAYEATNQPHKAMAWDYRAYQLDPACRTAPVNLARLLQGKEPCVPGPETMIGAMEGVCI